MSPFSLSTAPLSIQNILQTVERLLVNEKYDINDKPKWKSIRNWPHQHFIKNL